MAEWSNLSRVVYRRTYARKDTGKLERWADTVERVIAGNVRGHRVTEDEIQRLRFFLTERKAGPAGRGLWFSGAPAHEKLGGAATVNCWGVDSSDWHAYVVAMDLLMLGGGVGMSVEHRYTSRLPKVRQNVRIEHRNTKDADFIVPDSREGWVELVRRTLESLFVTGRSFSFSTICVRPGGDPILGFGGTASGPRPLIECVEKIHAILSTRAGKHVRPIDAADLLCCIGEMVVAGNVRRSAIIILGDPWDREYLTAKRWDLGGVPTYRAMANFSVVASDVDELHPLFWKTYESGEPFGIVNRKAIQTFGRIGEYKQDTASIVNPCVPAGTEILTDEGYREISSLVGQTVNVWNGFEFSPVQPQVTGHDQKLVRVTLSDGRSLTCTLAHKWVLATEEKVRADQLREGDDVFAFRIPGTDSQTLRHRVVSIEDAGTAETVYCFKEGLRGLGCFDGIVTGQCAEACLEPYEPCNLQEIALPNLSGAQEFIEAARLMHRWGKRVTCDAYHWPQVEEVIRRNRRIGTGITGCLQSPLFAPEYLDQAYAAIQQENVAYSRELGIPESIRTTVVKPSGTMSKVMDVYEGIHPAYSRHYIQRIRFGANDPLIPHLRAAGHHIEPQIRFDGSLDHNTLVVDFYCRAPDGAPVADEDWDTWKQLEVVRTATKHWADQAVSVTVYYRREELPKIKEWLTENLSSLKTISFLCHSDHGFLQAPKEAITKEQYDALSSVITPLSEEAIDGGDLESMECAGGACPIK